MSGRSVRDLLLPGTPDSVAERYLTLAERAQSQTFDVLEEDLVVLDTETTGLSFRDCELIEIAAAHLSGREVVERFQTFVCPARPIPKEIQELTGITQLDVADAPEATEAVAQLAEFVGGMPILAHNASFDRTFVEKVPGGRDVTDTWIDTLSLSRMALPRFSSHRLSDMAQAFGCDSVTHRAMDDVDALCGMWRIILLGLADLPVGLLGHLAGMHEEVDWSFRPILSHLAVVGDGARDVPIEATGASFSLKAHRHDLTHETQARVRSDAAEGGPLEVDGREQTRELFSADGMVGQMYEQYESRPDQVEMALEVRDALETSTHRAIEAGTGVGKSMAYLLPMVRFAQRNNVTVGIATKTNALTDQLVSHELPALDRVLEGGVSFTSLKGYDHYPCLHRLDRAAAGELPDALLRAPNRSLGAIKADVLTALAVTYAFCCQSPEGDLDALGIRWRYVPRSLLTTTPAECLRSKCPYYPGECLVHGARRRAAQSDVVVTNHSLLLRNIDIDGKILPPIRHWVVDEAHSFESEARRQWAREVSGQLVREGFELLGGTKSGAIRQIMAQAGELEDSTLHTRLLTKLAAAASRASVSTADLFDRLHELGRVTSGGGGYENTTLWIDDGVRATPEWAGLSEAAFVAIDRLDEVAKDVRECSEALAQSSPQLGGDIAEAGSFAATLLADLRLIVLGEDKTYVYSAQLARRRRDIASERLVAEKLDIGADLGARWLPEMMSVTFTSATIAVGESFDHFDHAVGLDTLDASMRRDVRLTSSFDYDANMSVIVARDLPEPNNPRYLGALEDLLFDVHVAMGGSVLTLFTNRRDMERVYAGLAPRLAAVGLELAQQERGSSPRRLRESFLNDKTSSLLALKSFWEGFDATGDTLRCVVIPKLPFASPYDPLVRERDLREDRAWWRYSLPEAVIEVKQAAGRLIRTASDTGVLVLADSRLATKRYGRQFISSLPKGEATPLEAANVRRYIEMWRHTHE
jgi:ATP-dependent DNA helicase DinG